MVADGVFQNFFPHSLVRNDDPISLHVWFAQHIEEKRKVGAKTLRNSLNRIDAVIEEVSQLANSRIKKFPSIFELN